MIAYFHTPSALSIIIVSFNTRDILCGCLDAIYSMTYDPATEIIVVDNNSIDGTDRMLKERFPRVKTIFNRDNLGFGAANNKGMALAEGEVFLLLNSDTIASPAAIEKCREYLVHNPFIGLLGCRLETEPGLLQLSCGRFFNLAHAVFGGVVINRALRKLGGKPLKMFEHILCEEDHGETAEVDWVSGAFMMLKRKVFEETGGFDAKIFLYGEEHEWCYRVKKAGWGILYYPSAKIIHLGKASGKWMKQSKRIMLITAAEDYFFRKHFGTLYAFSFRQFVFIAAIFKIILWSMISLICKRPRGKVFHNLAVVKWYIFGSAL